MKCDVCGANRKGYQLDKRLQARKSRHVCAGCLKFANRWVTHYQNLAWKRVKRKLRHIQEIRVANFTKELP